MIAWFFFIFNAQAESPASLDLDGLTPILERQAKPRSYTGKATRVAGTAPLPDGLPRSAGDAAGDPSSLVQEQSLLRTKRGQSGACDCWGWLGVGSMTRFFF